MKRRMIFAAALALGMILAACTQGGKGKSSGGAVQRDSSAAVDPLNQSEKMKLRIAALQGYTQSGSRTEKWIEERYNVDIELIALPGWSDSPAKISLLMADDAQRPDIIWWWGMETDFAKWKNAGLLVDVTDYMNKYTTIRDYYNSQDPKTLFLASSEEGRIFRIPGDVSEPSCETLWIRQDWLDNLGLNVPTTLAELEDVLYKFTFDDPDGNGKNDTYGLGGDGYDFRSFWPWIQGAGSGRGDYSAFVIQPDGSYAYGPATDDAKIWLGKVAKLYADGVITSNIINDTDRDEEMARGGFGVTYSWIAYNNPSYAPMRSFYASNPTAKWVP
ncbi:MAG: extracellular solute-binding protein, partial [Treponema sp.]|nr:extracellular solute-binding protein [Treponema sp.]